MSSIVICQLIWGDFFDFLLSASFSFLIHMAQSQNLTSVIACLILFLHSTVLDISKLFSVAAFDENMLMELIFHIIDYN